MTLTLTKRMSKGIPIVDVSGRIVFGEECTTLRNEIKELLSVPEPYVVLNLRDVTYVDSGGIGMLVGLYTSARSAGGDLKLACANEKVEHVLKITRLLPVIGMYRDELSAIAACERRASA